MKTCICGEFRDLAHWYNFERLRNSTNTGDTMKCPKKHVKEIFLSCDGNCIYFWNAPKSKDFNFGQFSVWKPSHVLFPRNASLWIAQKSWNAPIFRTRWETWGISKISNDWKWGISRKRHVTRYSNRKMTEIEILRLWGISEINVNSITWQNPPSQAFCGISWYPLYNQLNQKLSKCTYCSHVTWSSINGARVRFEIFGLI